MSGTLSYRPRPGEIPTSPGVYRFRDENARVLYVGKAKNLRARLSNYFAPLPSLHERTRRMVTTAKSVEWTVVGSDIDALQLEYTWIKEFEPPFNVQFRDDKSYPYLAVTMGDDVPLALITRNRGIRGARYFGPYTKVWAIRETLDLLLKAFPMRSCSQSIYDRAEPTGRPFTLRWSVWTTLLALACSVPPFATLLFEWWAVRTGRLNTSDRSTSRVSVAA